MEFRNVVFNAARDGKLRRLKVRNVFPQTLFLSVISATNNNAQYKKFSHQRHMMMDQYDVM